MAATNYTWYNKGMAVLYNFELKFIKGAMKANTQKEDSDSDSDNSPFRQWLQTKSKTQANPVKKTLKADEGKKTVKYSADPVMNSMYEKILRESDKFQDEPEQSAPAAEPEELSEYSPHMLCGQIKNPHECSNTERKLYGLEDEGICKCFDLTGRVVVVMIGKNGYELLEGLHANLYLPKEYYEYMGLKKEDIGKVPIPDRLIPLQGDKFAVVLKRQLRNSSLNILDHAYLILDPHNQLYPTYICSWIDCKRRITLSNYIQSDKDVNEAMIFGNTSHRMLEWLADKRFTVEEYFKDKEKVHKSLYDSMLYDMYLIDSSLEKFVTACEEGLRNIVNFFSRHIEKRQELEVDRNRRLYLKIEKIVSSEGMFRSNFFGLKGKIDLLLYGELINKKTGTSEGVFVPMQLKTGKKVSDAHKRQTQIYNILVREKYKQSVIGLLYYSNPNIKYFREEDPVSAYEIIVVHRNQIAINLVRLYQQPKIVLPTFAEGFMQCNFCELSTTCELSFTHLEKEGKIKPSVQLPSKYHPNIKSGVAAYSQAETNYFCQWMKLIHLEQLQEKKFNTNYWKMGISHFKLGYQQLTQLASHQADPSGKVRLEITHQCRSIYELDVFDNYYKVSQKVRVFISALSFIEGCKVVEESIDLTTLVFTLLIETNNSQIGINKAKVLFFLNNQHENSVQVETFQSNFFAAMRNTVITLMESKLPLKDILLAKEEKEVIDVQRQQLEKVRIEKQELQGLNQDQRKAYKQSVRADKFCLVEGMPGTGKTELIIRMIHKFNKMGKKILITTFTNRSLDNILERLVQSQLVPSEVIIRQGSQYSNSLALQEFTSRRQEFKTLSDYKQFFGKKQIWFVTLSSLFIHHLPTSFDVVILDEASQCLQPLCISALLKASKFILIGDYKQLQPVIKSKQAFKQGMWLSLFERLCKQYPQNTVALKKQYRMNYKIMALSNLLVYDNQLELANDSLKDKAINLCSNWRTIVPASFQQIINPKNAIVFINYDPIINALTKKYMDKEPQIRKVIETQLTAFVYYILCSLEVPKGCISVMTAYNNSVNKITKLLQKKGCLEESRGSVLTIDKSQGIDKEAIILLIEKDNNDLIEDPRRLNVALTRAKSKLIVVGSEAYLCQMDVWAGTLGKLLGDYMHDLSKKMIEDMINYFQDAPSTK